MQSIVVIGSKGQLGQDLIFALEEAGKQAVAADLPDVDVRDRAKIHDLLSELRPSAVINLAAFHEVDKCEDEADQAFAVNAAGAYQVAAEAQAVGARTVFISTDYVFSKMPENPRPYIEKDQPDPRSVYAISKRAGERLVMSASDRAIVFRSCGLYGESPPAGKAYNFPGRILELAKQGKPLRVVDDQICTPTWTKPLARTIVSTLDTELFGIVHATAHGSCSWYEFAKAIIEMSGMKTDLQAISSETLAAKAYRPEYSVLDNSRLGEFKLDIFKHWRDDLADYLELIGEKKS